MASIIIWECFTSGGVGNICRIYDHMDGDLYCQILEEDLLGTIEWHEMDKNNVIFQQDNDPSILHVSPSSGLKIMILEYLIDQHKHQI